MQCTTLKHTQVKYTNCKLLSKVTICVCESLIIFISVKERKNAEQLEKLNQFIFHALHSEKKSG